VSILLSPFIAAAHSRLWHKADQHLHRKNSCTSSTLQRATAMLGSEALLVDRERVAIERQ
jgi:hypothetical protein